MFPGNLAPTGLDYGAPLPSLFQLDLANPSHHWGENESGYFSPASFLPALAHGSGSGQDFPLRWLPRLWGGRLDGPRFLQAPSTSTQGWQRLPAGLSLSASRCLLGLLGLWSLPIPVQTSCPERLTITREAHLLQPVEDFSGSFLVPRAFAIWVNSLLPWSWNCTP